VELPVGNPLVLGGHLVGVSPPKKTAQLVGQRRTFWRYVEHVDPESDLWYLLICFKFKYYFHFVSIYFSRFIVRFSLAFLCHCRLMVI